MPEKSRGQTHRCDIHEAKSTDAGVDKLLRHWKHERLLEAIRPVDAAQGQSGHPQAMEETENHLPKSAKTEPIREMQPTR